MDNNQTKEEAENLKIKGNEAYKNKHYTEAIDLYTKAIELNKSEPSYLTNRATAYLKLNDVESAVIDCKLALEIKPDFSKAYNRMSKCHVIKGDLKEASILLQRAIELEPGNEMNKKD